MEDYKICGLVGVAGVITGTEERIFKQLLIIDTLRGEHSTGIAAVNHAQYVSIAKCVGDPFQLFDTRSSQAVFKQANRVLIGHNRYATSGKITRQNAHPFEIGHIVGAHNGTLTNKYSIPGHGDFDVDSEAMFNHISNVGIEEAMKVIRGAWAMTFFDADKNTINLLRNEERPLYFAMNKEHRVLFWASEAWMLYSVTAREKYAIDTVYELPVDTLYSFKIAFENLANFKFEKAKVRTIKGAPPVIASTYSHYSSIGITNYPKKEETKENSKNSFNASYLGSNRIFEVGIEAKDDKGNVFCYLEDSMNPDYDVRIFDKMIAYEKGAFVKATVIGCRHDPAGHMFYTVGLQTITPIKKEEETKEKLDNVFTWRPKDNRGHEISDADLKDYYGQCSWCTNPINHKDHNNVYLSIEHGVVCGDCSADPQIKDFLRTQ